MNTRQVGKHKLVEPLRVAVLLSAQTRTWELCHENIKRFYEKGKKLHFRARASRFKVDYFCHTWDINSWRNPTEQHGTDKSFVTEQVSSDLKDRLKEVYNPKEIEIESFDDWKTGLDKRVLNIQPNTNQAWLPMFYSFQKSNQMKRNYEQENNFQYDIVFKQRYDVLYDREYPIGINNPESTFGNRALWTFSNHVRKDFNEFFSNDFNDVTFYSDSPTMDIVSNIYDWLLKPGGNWVQNTYGPGSLIYKFLINHSILPSWDNSYNQLPIRKESLDAGLKWPDDRKQIKQDAINFYK